MYEKYWESDDEKDAAELAEIMRDEFIANLKKGGQMPLVLPAKDENQFRKLLTKKALKSDQDAMDDEPSIKSELMEISSQIIEQSISSTTNNNRTSSKSQAEMEPGATIKNIVHDSSSPLMLFQLPSSLVALSDSSKPLFLSDAAMPSQIKAGTTLKQQQPNAKPATTDFQGKAKHCLSGFPTGVEIGKLQILRSGRAVMNIGGQVMDITEAIPSRYFETAVYIETHTDERPPAGPSTSTTAIRSSANINNSNGGGIFTSKTNSIFPLPSTTTTAINMASRENMKTKNSISVMGEIPYSFVCSYDLRSSRKNRCSNTSTSKNQRI